MQAHHGTVVVRVNAPPEHGRKIVPMKKRRSGASGRRFTIRAVLLARCGRPYEQRRMGFDPPTVQPLRPRLVCRSSLGATMKIENVLATNKPNALANPNCDADLRTRLDWAFAYAKRGLAVFSTVLDTRRALHVRERLRQERRQASPRQRRLQSCDHRCAPNRKRGGASGRMQTSELPRALFPASSLLISTAQMASHFYESYDQHEPLPRTAIVKTSRGWHLHFKLPAKCALIPCSTGDGLDVRADGGYVVAPPSRHLSGHVYQWCEHVG